MTPAGRGSLQDSEKTAIAILIDEAESYLSAVGTEDDAAAKIRWAIRISKRLIGEDG